MPTIVLEGIDQLKEYEGKEIGPSKKVHVTQEKIQKFAESTGDFQWIHVDVERAKRESPYKGPIAHGYLTLSLISDLFFDLLEVKGFKSVINYGTNKVRFTAPVPSGSYVSMTVKMKEVNEIKTGYQCIFSCVLTAEGSDRPACVAEIVFLLMN